MKFPESWLRTLVDPKLSTKELATTLTMAGIEVETLEPVAPPFTKVVVAKVLEVAKHPNADKLTLCQVDVGEARPLSIVCGAPNVKAGMKVPCALVGAELAGGMKIKQAKVRGTESNGMLCSARELGLSDDHSGILALSDDAAIGEDFRKHAHLDDHLFTLKLTPNRGDCLSLLGIAREVSHLTGAALCEPENRSVRNEIDGVRAIRLANPEGCPRYCGRIIRGVNARAATPAWMIERLERAGLRSISAIVDVTNYVMLEIGQPLHAFDDARLEGAVIVRWAKPGEKLVLINGKEHLLEPDILMIADERKALALAGIMGGLESEISLDTTDVFLEAAFFSPGAIAGRPRRLNMTSDASYRFERGVDPDVTVRAMERATELIVELCGGRAGPIGEARDVAHLPARKPVTLRTSRAAKILGVRLGDEDIARILGQLAFSFERQADGFSVKPPSYRFDIEIEEDLVEEVARVHGYDNIPTRPPTAVTELLPQPEEQRTLWQLKHILCDREYFEVINYSFVDRAWEADFAGNADPILLENPIAEQMGVMRSTLIGGLVATLRYNLARKVDRVRVFESGRAFLRTSAAPDERRSDQAVKGYDQPRRIAGLACGLALEEQWGEKARAVDFFDVKGDVEALIAPQRPEFVKAAHPALHPGRSARIELAGKPVGWIGEVHPRWQQQYELPTPPVVFELDLEPLISVGLPQYKEVSRFPSVVRDLAIVVDETAPARALLGALFAEGPPIVQDVKLFDLYRGPGVEKGRKSLAFRVVMQDTARTLTDAEVDAAMARLTEILASRYGAKLRS
ncbi:MAG: phenylalanine--tRNA ligase subunit beta [Betaproteobacteria bacterium]|jgi:phenylalanyl-tRNA synthetase beta chain|nr:phenylalanine--tRNA ligase subunit beta [Betaproteobacteria bacterium]